MQTRIWLTLGTLALGLAAASPASAQYARPYYEVEEVEAEDPDFARFRFGISGLGGYSFAGGPDQGLGGAALRLGVQLGDLFAIYYQPTGLIGSFTNRDPGRDSISGQMWNTGMLDLTLFDMLQIGGGVSADFIWGCDETIQEEVACAESDIAFGAEGRLALVLGGAEPGYRDGFVIEARIHSTWYDDDDASVAVLGGLGYEVY